MESTTIRGDPEVSRSISSGSPTSYLPHCRPAMAPWSSGPLTSQTASSPARTARTRRDDGEALTPASTSPTTRCTPCPHIRAAPPDGCTCEDAMSVMTFMICYKHTRYCPVDSRCHSNPTCRSPLLFPAPPLTPVGCAIWISHF